MSGISVMIGSYELHGSLAWTCQHCGEVGGGYVHQSRHTTPKQPGSGGGGDACGWCAQELIHAPSSCRLVSDGLLIP
jgi:hypothetical protein